MITEKINIDPEFQSQKIYLFSCPFIMLKPLMTMHHIPNQCTGCQFIKLSKLLDQLDNLLYKSRWGLIRRDTNTARYTQPIIGNPNSLSNISFKMIKPTTKAPILNKIVTHWLDILVEFIPVCNSLTNSSTLQRLIINTAINIPPIGNIYLEDR